MLRSRVLSYPPYFVGGLGEGETKLRARERTMAAATRRVGL